MLIALLLGLLCGFIGSVPIAGPTAVLVVNRALHGHTLDALEIAIGGAIAESLYAALAFLGMTAAFSRFHWLLPASRVSAAVILVGLGLYFALGPERKPHEPAAPRPRRGGKVVLGFLVTGINPTLIVSWSAVVAMLHGVATLRTSVLDAIPFALGVGVGIVAWFGGSLALLRKFRDRLHEDTLDKVIRGMGWILVVAGVALLVNLLVRAAS